jgi:microcin C transport system ATP-binding protein
LQVDGQPWGRDGPADKALRRTMQVVYQDPFSSLSPRMTVEEIVGEGLRVHAAGHERGERQQQGPGSALAEVGLAENQFPNLLRALSARVFGWAAPAAGDRTGADRRTPAAGAGRTDQCARCDDPEAGARSAARLQRERGLSYLLITHDVDVIRAMAHHVIVLKDGDIVEAGPLAQVLDHPVHPYTQTLVQLSA